LRERLETDEKVRDTYQNGHLPTIHVSLGAIQAAKQPPAQQFETVSGD
jgi:hypothetical protein